MHPPHPAAWRRCASRLATLASLNFVGGCAEGGATAPGLWWFATAALLLVAAMAFALGRSLQRQRTPAPEPKASGHCAVHGDTAPSPDELDTDLAACAAEDLLLSECTSAAVLARSSADGWRVLKVNTAAGARWPALQPGAAVAEAIAAAPLAVMQACDELRPGQAQDVQGWRLAAYGPLANGARGLLVKAPGDLGTVSHTPETDSFSFTVSHDLRAPIRVVEGFTRIVKEDYGHLLDRVGNDHLDRVLGAAARMNQMIDALLTLARLSQQPLSRQPVNLSQLAGYVVDDLRRGAPDREADIHIEPGLFAQGDPTLLRLVLENLLGNAWKYSARCLRARISLQRAPHGKGWAYVVRDNGAGFDMRSSDRLFGLFQRLHGASEFPGTGVGLASVRRIVQRHGGEIWAEAELGRGASFFFTLAD